MRNSSQSGDQGNYLPYRRPLKCLQDLRIPQQDYDIDHYAHRDSTDGIVTSHVSLPTPFRVHLYLPFRGHAIR